MDRIGSLYIDFTTGIAYRLTGYQHDFKTVYNAEKEAREAGREFGEADYAALRNVPRYSVMTLDGYAGSESELPAAAQRVFQPAE